MIPVTRADADALTKLRHSICELRAAVCNARPAVAAADAAVDDTVTALDDAESALAGAEMAVLDHLEELDHIESGDLGVDETGSYPLLYPRYP